MQYYKRNLGDYAKKAGRLSMLQHGAYNNLIDACYDREKFPTREEAIDWTWASTPEEIDAVDFVLRKFFTLEDGVYVQNRIKEEIDEYHSFCKSQAEKGKKGGRPKGSKSNQKEGQKKPDGFSNKPDGFNSEPDGNPNETQKKPKPLTTNQEPLIKSKALSSKLDISPEQEVFDYWKTVMQKSNRVVLDSKRKSAIKARLREGRSIADIKLAIDGCSTTPHNMGRNKNRQRYDDIELICRNASNLERFIANAQQHEENENWFDEVADSDFIDGEFTVEKTNAA